MKSSSFLYNRPAPGCCSFDYELWVDSDDSHQNYSYVVHANFAGTKCDVEVIKGYIMMVFDIEGGASCCSQEVKQHPTLYLNC